jgi:hypothetical protein
MKRLLVISLFALASLLLVPSALSDPPTIQTFPIDATFLDTVDCAFPVQIDIAGTDLEITSASGDRVFDAFPNSRATLTNLDTGTSLTVNIAGPSHTTIGADGSITFVGTGTALFFLQFRGNPGITFFIGRFVLTFDAQGNETSFSTVGTSRDLCAELAG